MRFLHVVHRCGLALLLVTIASCAPHKTDDMKPSPGVYESPDDIKFSVKLTPTRFAMGEAVNLEASLFNGGKKSFDRGFPSGCQWDYEVADASGRVMTPPRMCTMATTELHLEPGELRMIVRDWKGNDEYFGIAHSLPPGRYAVNAGFIDQDMRVVPMSEPVWFEVVPGRKSR